jgi:hypothetical protein
MSVQNYICAKDGEVTGLRAPANKAKTIPGAGDGKRYGVFAFKASWERFYAFLLRVMGRMGTDPSIRLRVELIYSSADGGDYRRLKMGTRATIAQLMSKPQ